MLMHMMPHQDQEGIFKFVSFGHTVGDEGGRCAAVRAKADKLVGGAPKYSSVHCGISAHVLDTPYPEDVTSELEVREVFFGF